MDNRPPHFAHQLEAFDKAKGHESFGLLMEAGTAKTRVEVDEMFYHYGKGTIDTALIIAPNGVHSNWMGEVQTWAPDAPYSFAYYQAGASKRHQAWYEDTVNYTKGLRILAVNIEALSNEKGFKHVMSLTKRRKVLTIVDESSRIKSPSSSRSRNAKKVGDVSELRRILTGTSVSQGYHDLWSQFRYLDWRIIGCKTFTEFKSEYCIMGGYEMSEIVAYTNIDRLFEKINPYVYQKLKKDCLDLPPEMHIRREVNLSDEQRRHYREIRDEYITLLKGVQGDYLDELQATQAGVRDLRLRQILSGFFPHADGTWTNLPCPRLDAAADLVEEASSGKVIVWCQFHADILNMEAKLKSRGINSVLYYGGIGATKRLENLTRWRQDPKITALVASPPTGGIGLTLNEADTDVTYSHDYNYETWEQKCARNYRAGQTKPVTHYNMVARGTADVKMLARVEKKGDRVRIMKDKLALLAELED